MLCSVVKDKFYNFSILDGLRLLCEPDSVYELRCPKAGRNGTLSGCFSDLDLLAESAKAWSGCVPGVYVTLNPVNAACLQRAPNRIKANATVATADQEIAKRTRLLLDFDPTRPSNTSSTQEEHGAALNRARRCREWLRAQDLPEPILADSGNGAHLVYGLNLPNDDLSRLLIEDVLRAVSKRFSDKQVTIDQSVYNAARISKVYGTKACKGDDLSDRPHRLSQILEAPDCLKPVPHDRLSILAKPDREESEAWVETFLAQHKIDVRDCKQDNGQWIKRWVLKRCPFCRSEDTAAAITLDQEGKIGFRCQHNRCSEPRKHWADLRRHFEQERKNQGKSSRVGQLVEHALTNCELASDESSEEALARIPGSGWRPVESKAFRTWLVDSFRQANGSIVRAGELSDALLNISSSSQQTRRRTYHRVAYDDGHIYLDLAIGKAVEITGDGWKVIDNPPVLFLTKKDMAALPIPEAGGDIEELRDFVNVGEEDFALLLGWLLDSLKGRKPYSVLVVNGEQGSGKSTFATLASDLVDPCKVAKTKKLPTDIRDLAVLASNRHLLAFDNVSWLSEDMSDALCRLATGSGMVLRSLYSNADEQIFGGARPILLNGIPEIGDRSDFLGRTVKITLRAIPDDKRSDEQSLLARFQARRPFLLGALCTLLSNGLTHQGKVTAAHKPRMADTFMWLLACEAETNKRLANSFADNLRENVRGLALETLLGRAVVEFLTIQAKGYIWNGRPNDLYDRLRPYWDAACGNSHKEKDKYPGNARALSSRLIEMMASFRENGIVIDKTRNGNGRAITMDGRDYFRKPAAQGGDR